MPHLISMMPCQNLPK